MDIKFNRRTFLKSSAAAGLMLNLPGSWPRAWAQAPLAEDAEILLRAKPNSVPLIDGPNTNCLSYEATLLQGPTATLSSIKGSYLGPIMRFRQGQRVKIHFENGLAEPTIVHWHGFHLPENMDSHPSYAIAPGEKFEYEFTVDQRPGLYWYHPHPHGRTGYQTYQGLAGLIVVTDDNESGLPAGEFDLTFCVQDRRFEKTTNQLAYLTNQMDEMMGMMGDTLFLNGKRREAQAVSQDGYRLRILNGSNARMYNLAWSDGSPVTVIGTDGGLLEAPIDKASVILAPGQRIEIFKSFADLPVGSKLDLVSKAKKPFAVVPFEITAGQKAAHTLPLKLSTIEKLDPRQAVNSDAPKRFVFSMDNNATIDGLTYEMKSVRDKETVKLGSVEIWEFEVANDMMAHPVHIHGGQFQILSRTGDPIASLLDEGWHDTVLAIPGETVRIIKRFDKYSGYFPFHCHILEHEALGMMRDFLVK